MLWSRNFGFESRPCPFFRLLASLVNIIFKTHRGKRIFKVWSLFLDGVPFFHFLSIFYFFIFYFFIFIFIFIYFYLFIYFYFFNIYFFKFFKFFYFLFFHFYFFIFYFFIFLFFYFFIIYLFIFRVTSSPTHPPLPLSFLPSPTHPSSLFFPLALPTIPEPLPTLAEARTSVTSSSENMVARVP